MSLRLETPRLIIQSWTDSDADLNHAIKLAKDVGYTSFSLPGQLVATRESAKDLISDRMALFASKKVSKFLVLLKENNEPIGTCGLGVYETDGKEQMELGYRLCLEQWGKGYAT